MYCSNCGSKLEKDVRFCSNCGKPITIGSVSVRTQAIYDAIFIAKKIKDREIAVNIIWIVIGIAQLFFGTAAIVGIWNIVNAVIFLFNSGKIRAGNAEVVEYFKSRLIPIIIAIGLNLVIGGVIGAFLAGYELYIRKNVLDNQNVFSGEQVISIH